MRAYLDADILIWHLRNHPSAVALIASLHATRTELWIAAAQRMEILAYMRPSEETKTLQLLGLLNTQPITEAIVDLGAALFRRFSPSHGVDKNDALLAAAAILTDGRVITLNVKHFPMPGLVVERGWLE
ncbi:MAG: PIN domain-containing protein [Dehalococcoidia bacterium]